MSLFHSKSVSVKLVGHNLVASLPTANPPLIWQFDLERNHSFAIALQGEAGDWELGVTSPKGDFYPVAHFPAKEDAEEALFKVQKILMKKRRSVFWRGLCWIIGVLLILALAYLALEYMNLAKLPTFGIAAPVSGNSGLTPGVPMSAEDALKAQH